MTNIELEKLVERLEDEQMRLAGRSIDHGCVDSGLSANLAMEAATAIESLQADIVRLRSALLPFSSDRLSTEAETSDCLYRSPASAARLRADAMELRDRQILAARQALQPRVEG